jgi:succinate dehydrogenase/fumarate reductase iron-sulfur protein
MSSYIPPIERPERTFTLLVQRFDPDRDTTPRWQSFSVPWVPTMTVVEALEWLADEGHYVAFRANCREFTCGSCAMRIDGKPALACDTPLADGMRLEPLGRYPVQRDLIVDTSPVRAKWRQLKLWPHRTSPEPLRNVPRSTLDAWHRSYARCIECYACLDSCPASASEQSAFSGPMWMLQIARQHSHPLDGADRLSQAIGEGLGRCVSCYECAEVCPVGLSPVLEIQQIRRQVIVDRLKRLLAGLGLGPVSWKGSP